MNGPTQGYDRVKLVWPGKRTEVERVRLPFQVIERVNDVRRSREGQAPILTAATNLPDWWPEGWRNKLIWGDNKYVLASLLDEFVGKVDLIYVDPPFATGNDFSYDVKVGDVQVTKQPTIIEETAYRDTWESYAQFFYDRMVLARELLKGNGSVYVHLDPTVGHYAKVILDEVFGAESFQREIVWRIGWISGYKSRAQNWIRNHDLIYYYTKNPENFTFNKQYVPYDADYRRRGEDALPDDGSGYPIEDVWNANRFEFALRGEESLDSIQIKSFSQEKTGFPTQKNASLVRRVIRASSNPGDLVLDFFVGSGTTVVAAEQTDRRWLGVDLSRFGVHTARKRLLDISECRPFEVLNLGRYERRYWQGIEAGEAIHEYYRFILELYGAQPISGFTYLHGERDGRFVHVGATASPVTLDELERTLEECTANGLTAVDVLGWEWEMGLNPAGKDGLAARHHVDVRLFHIPREVMDKRAVDAGDVHFFELSVVEVEAEIDKSKVEVELTGFLPAVDDYMREKVSGKVTKWSDWIDYWSIDFAFDGKTFVNQWQAYRTRKDPKLALRSDPHEYTDHGERRVVVKVVDIFGNDTTHELRVTIEPQLVRR